MELNALRYLSDRDDGFGREVVNETLKLMQDFTWPNKQDISRAIGRMMVTGAKVYDWCYELLEPEQTDAIIEQFIRLDESLDINEDVGLDQVKDGEREPDAKPTVANDPHLDDWWVARSSDRPDDENNPAS